MKKKSKSQGEIFGVALLFVIIIIGFIVFTQIKATKDFDNHDPKQEGKYEILAKGTLNTILKTSTGCYVERHSDSIKDLINYCLENDNYYADIDPEIQCGSETYNACEHAITLINYTLRNLYNDSDSPVSLGNIPYKMHMDLPSNQNTYLSNKTFTNLCDFEYKGNQICEEDLSKYGYKRVPSGLISFPTSDRNIKFELFLYYR
jgi:hypothetical protein